MAEFMYGGTASPFVAAAAVTISASQPPEQLNVELSGVITLVAVPSPLTHEVSPIKDVEVPLPSVRALDAHKLIATRLFDEEDGENVGVPGVAYAEQAPLPNKRAKIDFRKFEMLEARIVVTAQGDEAGAGKGIEIYDQTGGAQLCEVTWDGAALQQALAGSWTSTHIPNSDSELRIRVKGSSGTESITIYAVDLQIKVSEQSLPV